MRDFVGKGLLCVLSSPSGGGKTSVIREILRRKPDYTYSISATTRPRRGHEKDGIDYYFLSKKDFEEGIKRGDFIEWAEVHGHLYGTPRESIEVKLKQGKVVLLDIDVEGGMAIKRLYTDRALLIFLKPPSVETLVERLKKRSTETEAQIKKRLERIPKEMAFADFYDVVIINDDFDQTVNQVIEAIETYRKQVEVKKNG
ncbi:MAG: guanylate kinase [Calditrichaeota bacterium]|nr:guanylate kinase [Calditrichota bacterium]